MPSFTSPERLARLATRRPWTGIGAWVLAIVAAAALIPQLGGALSTASTLFVSTDSETAQKLMEDGITGPLPGRETVVVHSDSLTVDVAAFRRVVAGLTARLNAASPDVVSATSYLDGPGDSFVSRDRHTTIIPVVLAGKQVDAADHVQPILDAVRAVDGVDGFSVSTGGDGSTSEAFTAQSEKDLQTAEVIGLPIALLVLVLVFGALVAAGLPLLLGMLSIAIALGISAVIGFEFDLSIFVVNLITTMGLAVGIDYTLLIVQRFREERARGLDRDAAIIKAGGTASRAVLFSGMAVVVALSGLLLVPELIFRSMAAGAIAVVIVAVIAALTLLPAVLRLLGDRVNAVALPWSRSAHRPSAVGAAPRRGFWDWSTGVVMRHPKLSVVLSVAFLVSAALPYATIRLGFAGVSTLPHDSEAYRAFRALDREFSAGVLAPADIVIDNHQLSPTAAAATDTLLARLRQDPAFGPAEVASNSTADLALIRVPLAGDPQGDGARAAVNRLRHDYVPAAFGQTSARVYVGGATASSMDGTDVLARYTPPVFAFVLGFSFLILLVVFRSIVVPLKAIVMNLLSVGAAYGLMVLVFQHGIGNRLFGFQQVDTIESWVPLFMFAILFGLSMDYHVFLLSRIRERYVETGRNAESVAYGVRSTAGMITGAALIMVAVFAGFGAGRMVMFQQMGFGLAVAVLLDATLVRTVLVPASMELLGNANWYLPSWLRWLPRVGVEGSAMPARGRRTLPGGADA